jgi:hypothetical protein
MISEGMAPSLPPNDPYAPLRVFADMAKAFADPAAFEQRMKRLIEQEQSAKAAIEQAAQDTAAAAKVVAAAEAEIAERRQKFEFETRAAADDHREKMTAERQRLEADRKAAAEARTRAQADAAKAADLKAEMQRRLRVMEGG